VTKKSLHPDVSILALGQPELIPAELVEALRRKNVSIQFENDFRNALDKIASSDCRVVLLRESQSSELFRPLQDKKDLIPINAHFIILTDGKAQAISDYPQANYTFLRYPADQRTSDNFIRFISSLLSTVPMNPDACGDLNKQNDRVLLLHDILSIIHQVRDFELTVEMILDTFTEFFKIQHVAIMLYDEAAEVWKISRHRNMKSDFIRDFSFSTMQLLKLKSLPESGCNKINADDIAQDSHFQKILAGSDSPYTCLFQSIYHEQLAAIVLIASDDDLEKKDIKLLEMIRVFADLLAPVMASFEQVDKKDYSLDSILNRIIRDRIQESRMMLSPISFGIFRIIPDQRPDDSVLLSETVANYQAHFRSEMRGKGDLIWLTLDTALLVFPKADLFTAETYCTDVKDKLADGDASKTANNKLILKHACLSYPQSGKDAGDVINNLWLKLFEELSHKEFVQLKD